MHEKLLVNGIKPGARPGRCEKNEGDAAEEKNYGSGRCLVATERVSADVTTEVIEYLVVDHFAEHRAGRAACRAADETGDHGACDGTAHCAGWSSQYTDRCAGFRTRQCERKAAGRAGDCANCSASLARAMASIDTIGLAFRARRDRAWLAIGSGVVRPWVRRGETLLERFILVFRPVQLVRIKWFVR